MESIICDRCGSNEFSKEENILICCYCGTRFQRKKELPKMEGITLSEDVQRLLQKCELEPHNARKYANLVLDIDPFNIEAQRYL